MEKIHKPQVLLVTPDFPLWDGGISTVSYELTKALNNIGVSTTVVTPLQTTGDLHFDRSLSFNVVRLANPKARIIAPYYQRLRLVSLLLRFRPQGIIACCWFPCGFALAKLKRLIKGPLAIIIHGSELIHYKFRSPFWRRKMYFTLKAADILIPVSRYVEKMLIDLGLPTEKITVVENGVDPDAFLGNMSKALARQKLGIGDEKVILTVARLVARKGQDIVLRALPKVVERVPNVKYFVVGKGSYEGRLKEIARELHLGSRVVFTGFVPQQDLPRYYWASDIFVMPSRIERDSGDVEGFGITFLEANVCGKPVVAGKSGGVEDAVVHGKTGFLVNPTSEKEISDKIVKLLTDEKLAESIGSQGRARILDEFTWNHIAQRYIRLLGLNPSTHTFENGSIS
ncbi:MAG: glycosyltransferase family 4 protein [Thermodesulfobacteriota bacterium]